MSYEYSVSVPKEDRAMFKQMAQKMGWKVSPIRHKLSPYEQSKKEAKEGKLFHAENAENMIKQILG